MMFGEFLLLVIPLLIGMVPFAFAARHLSLSKLLWLFVLLAIALFPLINLVIPSPFDSIDAILQIMVYADIMTGAIIGALLGKWWAKRANNNDQPPL